MRLFVLTAALMLSAIAPAHAVLEDYPSIKLQGLDKSVGRTVTFEAKVGSTIQYGPLYIKIHACRKAPPIEAPESAAFLQIWEIPPGGTESEWVFSGWMFASSPALSAMDHPVYDVWVIDCTGREEPNEEAAAAETTEEADQTSLPAADDAAPTIDEVRPEDIPLDGEAQMDEPAPQDPALSPQPAPAGIDPDAAYRPPAAPSPAPVYDPNAPYSPPPVTPSTPVSPQEEGIYSPSEGRVVPVPRANPYGTY